MRFFEETTLTPEREKEIRENNVRWLSGTHGIVLSCLGNDISMLLAEIELLRKQKAQLLEDVRIALRIK